MIALFTPESWLSTCVMRYLAFLGQIMILSKLQDGYLNQRVILFRLQYETHSLQMHPKSPCSSVVTPTPNLLERLYALRLVVVPCQYFPSLLPFFQPISPSPSSYISYVAISNLLRYRIHTCCTASPPPCSSVSVFTADLVCHPHYPASPWCLHCHPPVSLLWFSSHYCPSSRVLHHRCLSTFLYLILALRCSVLHCLIHSAQN